MLTIETNRTKWFHFGFSRVILAGAWDIPDEF